MKVFSFSQLLATGFDFESYQTIEVSGVFRAKLDRKCWGKKRNVLAYFTLDSGDKILASAWQDTGYLGIPNIKDGTVVTLTFEKAQNGISYLRKAEEDAGE